MEALRRLRELGFPTYLGYDKDELARIIESELTKDRKGKAYYLPHSRIASPDWKGADRAAAMVLALARSTHPQTSTEEASYAI